MFNMVEEWRELDPYKYNLFCVILRSNRVTNLIEAYTRDGSTRNTLSTNTMIASLGCAKTQTGRAAREEAEG